jgi:hypothetical protein
LLQGSFILFNTTVQYWANTEHIETCEKTHKLDFGQVNKISADLSNCIYSAANTYSVWHFVRNFNPSWYHVTNFFHNPHPKIDSTRTQSVMLSAGGTPCSIGWHVFLPGCCTNGWRNHIDNDNDSSTVNYMMENSNLMNIEWTKFKIFAVFSIVMTIFVVWRVAIIARSIFYWVLEPLMEKVQNDSKHKKTTRQDVKDDSKHKKITRRDVKACFSDKTFMKDILPYFREMICDKTFMKDILPYFREMICDKTFMKDILPYFREMICEEIREEAREEIQKLRAQMREEVRKEVQKSFEHEKRRRHSRTLGRQNDDKITQSHLDSSDSRMRSDWMNYKR